GVDGEDVGHRQEGRGAREELAFPRGAVLAQTEVAVERSGRVVGPVFGLFGCHRWASPGIRCGCRAAGTSAECRWTWVRRGTRRESTARGAGTVRGRARVGASLRRRGRPGRSD